LDGQLKRRDAKNADNFQPAKDEGSRTWRSALVSHPFVRTAAIGAASKSKSNRAV
jgi:hypothetical protein